MIFVDIFEYRESEFKIGSMCVFYLTILISVLIMPQFIMLSLIILISGVIFGIYLVVESKIPRKVEIDSDAIRFFKNGKLRALTRAEEATRVVYGFYNYGEGGMARSIVFSCIENSIPSHQKSNFGARQTGSHLEWR